MLQQGNPSAVAGAARSASSTSGGQPLATARTTRVDHLAAALGRHAGAKAVTPLAYQLAGLIGPLHGLSPFLSTSARPVSCFRTSSHVATRSMQPSGSKRHEQTHDPGAACDLTFPCDIANATAGTSDPLHQRKTQPRRAAKAATGPRCWDCGGLYGRVESSSIAGRSAALCRPAAYVRTSARVRKAFAMGHDARARVNSR